jgi:2-polyprenyl-3-methyl-5-hydroxy-6-metoxy-1,4-benzoquinol methylase
MKCYICGKSSFKTISPFVRDNENIKVLECTNCSLISLSTFNHIKKSHYEESKMHTDGFTLDQWIKETEIDDERRFNFLKDKIVNKKILDFGCGNGNFLIKSKKITSISEGIEIEKKNYSYFKKNNLKVYDSIKAASKNNNKFDLVTAFHVFEHLSNPLEILIELKNLIQDNGEIIIEVPNSDDSLISLHDLKAFKKFTFWSQHLFLFNQFNFTTLVKKSGLKINWIKQIQRYSLANNLYWLSKNKPGGHKNWTFLNNINLNNEYENALASVGKCDTILISVVK